MNKHAALQGLFAEAVSAHQAGAAAGAERICRQILAEDARHADSLHLLGIISAQAGQYAAAANLIGDAIAINDRVAAYHSNLGNIFHAQGVTESAITSYGKALALNPAFAEGHYNLANLLAGAGRRDAAAEHYAHALSVSPAFAAAHANFGHLLRDRGDLAAAADHYAQAVALSPQDVEVRFNLGNVLHAQGKHEAAVTCYENVLARAPALAEAHNNLGNVRKDQGLADQARACFARAVALKADYAEAHYNLGNVLSDQRDLAGAAVSYRAALAIRPDLAEAHYNLANSLKDMDQLSAAASHYEQAIALKPDYAEAHLNLANLLKAQDKTAEALARYRRALEVRPDFPDAQLALGGLLLLSGETEEANRLFHEVHRRRPISRRPAPGRLKGDFSVLLLTAQGAGHTPSSYLVSRAVYDACFLLMVTDGVYDIDALRAAGDVVVNLISDVDQSRAILPAAHDLVVRLGRPVVNPPARIMITDRAAVAARLAGIGGCRIPRIERMPGRDLMNGMLPPETSFPLLVRRCGSHGGDDFERLADAAAITAFVARKPDVDYYVSEYVPYESADGRFRKFRMIFVDGQILPYHLAIADQWKVHYFRTGMANRENLRREEAAFMADPRMVFGNDRWAALESVRDAIGLDYFGIDCALLPDGDLLVFEVNATMLVHDEQGVFAYKAPAIARIKQAFDTMLAKAARGGPVPASALN